MKQSGKKAAVVCYSLEGNTRKLARQAAKALQADIIELHPQKEVPQSFMKYVVGGGQTVFNSRVPLKPTRQNPENYDVLYLASPVWAGKIAAPMYSFLNGHQVADQVQGVLLTSKSGDIRRASRQIANLLPNARHVVSLIDERMPASRENAQKMQGWLHEIRREQSRRKRS